MNLEGGFVSRAIIAELSGRLTNERYMQLMRDDTKIRIQGAQAHARGVAFNECPYALGTDEAMIWRDGFVAASIAAKRGKKK